MIFLVPGSHANAARHFLCQAPANRGDEMGGHAVRAVERHRCGLRRNPPERIVLISDQSCYLSRASVRRRGTECAASVVFLTRRASSQALMSARR